MPREMLSKPEAGFFAVGIACGYKSTIVRRRATASPIKARKITATHKNRASVWFGFIVPGVPLGVPLKDTHAEAKLFPSHSRTLA